MDYVQVRGVAVPALGFGTWQLEGRACYDAVRHALELGYRHLDTAQAYGNEEQVGRALADSGVARDEVFLTTKLWRSDLGADRVEPATEGSLRRLGSDYVDLLLVHWPVYDVPVAETLGAMTELAEAGKVRCIGVSNHPPSLLRDAARHAPVFCHQVEYHPLLSQDRLLALADELDHLLTAYSPIAQGRVNDEPLVQEIAAAHGKTPAQVALRWLLQHPRVAAIPRSASAQRRAANLDVFDFTLTEEEVTALHDLAHQRDLRLIDPGFVRDWER